MALTGAYLNSTCNTMNRVSLSVLAGLLALSSLLGYLVYSGGQEIAELKQQNKSLIAASERAAERFKYDRKVLVARQAKIATQARKLAQSEQRLSEALESNKPWSDTDVPPDVQRALGGPSGAVPDSL